MMILRTGVRFGVTLGRFGGRFCPRFVTFVRLCQPRTCREGKRVICGVCLNVGDFAHRCIAKRVVYIRDMAVQFS